MATHYAVCNVNGPISVEIVADCDDEAVTAFRAMDHRALIDEPRMDAEEDFDIDGDGMSAEEFSAALRDAGCESVTSLEPIHNHHAGTTASLAGGWYLWRAPRDGAPEDEED